MVNETLLNATLHTLPWKPRNSTQPADWYTSVTDGVNVPGGLDRDLAFHLNRAYQGQCAETDFMMGRIMDALASSAAAKNTWSVYTADHGEMHLDHRIIQKMSMYEGSARVPLIVAPPPGLPNARRGVVEETLVSLVDVFPTFADITGAKTPEGMDGYSLLPLILGSDSASRPDYVVSEFHAEESNVSQFMIRQGRWKLIVYGRQGIYKDYKPQLFDVEADPTEQTNLAAQRPDLVDSMEATLRETLDYEHIALDVDNEGRAAVKRWMAHFNNSEPVIRELLDGAYYGFDQKGDWEKLVCWLNQNCTVDIRKVY